MDSHQIETLRLLRTVTPPALAHLSPAELAPVQPATPPSQKIRCPDCQSEFPAPAQGTRALCPTCGVALEILA